MLPDTLGKPAVALFSVCVVAAAMETLAGEGRTAQSFRGICALAASVMALRAIMCFLK